MSAQLVEHGSRKPLPDVSYKWKGQGGDEELESRPFVGQLWERVAETPSNAPAPLTARQDAGIVRAYAEMIGGQGPLARQHNGAKLYSGIIRAGVRVK